MTNYAKILVGDARTTLEAIPDKSIQCCVTSPPYWGLRDYGTDNQIGLEQSPKEYVDQMVSVFRQVHRILADDGVLWLNLGDTYAGNNSRASNNGRAGYGNERETVVSRIPDGLKPKDLVGIPWRVALALQDDGWWLRQDIIWHKTNPIPESVTDRCTKAHEYMFMLTKSSRYYFDNKAIAEPAKYAGDNRGARGDSRRGTMMNSINGATGETKNKRSVWTISTKPFKGAHFAVMPEALVEPPILATSRPGDTVFDPFTGAGTVAMVALRHGRNFVGTEINPEYAQIAYKRITDDQPMLNTVEVVEQENT